MRTGVNYQKALGDGRKVWVMNGGAVEDVRTHAATSAVVAEYIAWYDRHLDPAWRDRLFRPDGTPLAYLLPRTADDLHRMGKSFAATTFLNAGNLTHTPAYGHMIALGIETAVRGYGKFPAEVENATRYRESIAVSQRFLTFSSGAPTIGYRMRENPADRVALKIVRESADGIVVTGKVGMFTSPAYAEDVYVGGNSLLERDGHRVTFVVNLNAPGVTILCRQPASRDANPFVAPLSSRHDELDGQMWLDEVLIPHERVFHLDANVDPIARWLFWHQLYCWVTKAEFALGLGLACTDAMGLKEHPATVDLLLDMIIGVQTVRTCLTASELDPMFTPEGYAYPNHNHIAVGSLAMLKARQGITETLRILPGSSLVVAPSDTDLSSDEVGPGLTESFGGGGYTAVQRAALLKMAWDHASSGLDGRESAYELHANGGVPIWRGRLRKTFGRYNELANAVLRELSVEMPKIDLSVIPDAPMVPRRPVTAPRPAG